MRKKLLPAISVLFLPLFCSASNEVLQQRVDALENELKSLKQEIALHANDYDDSTQILENVERKTILDKINFSPELTLRFDKMNYTTGKIDGENTQIYNNDDPSLDGLQRRDEYSKNFDVTALIRFKLNMNAQIADNVNFHGRLIYMNSTQANQRLCILSRDIKSSESLSAFDVDLAYVNFTPNKSSEHAFTFSFGLLPTASGTPMQFAQNKKRSSMFPALVFDMNTYGIIGTQKITKDTFLRAVFAKAYTMRPTFYPYQCNRENIDNANIIGLFGDTKFNFLGESLLSLGLNILHDLKAHPYLGPDVSSEDSHILGNIITFGAGLDIQKFADTETTIFIHSALSSPHGNGEVDDYQIVDYVDGIGVTESGKVGFSEADYAKGEMISSDGYSIYLGAKYDMSSTINLGAEYNYGSKYWYSATQGAQDMYNKLAIRGHAIELYGIWKFHKNLYTKLGFISMQEEYTGSGWHFGEPAKKDALQKVSYLSLEAKF